MQQLIAEVASKPHPVHVPHDYKPAGDEIPLKGRRNRDGTPAVISATCKTCGSNALNPAHHTKKTEADDRPEIDMPDEDPEEEPEEPSGPETKRKAPLGRGPHPTSTNDAFADDPVYVAKRGNN